MFKWIIRKLNYLHLLIKVKKRQYSLSSLCCIWDNTNVKVEREIQMVCLKRSSEQSLQTLPHQEVLFMDENVYFFSLDINGSLAKLSRISEWSLFVLIFRCSSSRIGWFQQSNSYCSSSIFFALLHVNIKSSFKFVITVTIFCNHSNTDSDIL